MICHILGKEKHPLIFGAQNEHGHPKILLNQMFLDKIRNKTIDLSVDF
jgi:hypothetical protein